MVKLIFLINKKKSSCISLLPKLQSIHSTQMITSIGGPLTLILKVAILYAYRNVGFKVNIRNNPIAESFTDPQRKYLENSSKNPGFYDLFVHDLKLLFIFLKFCLS